MPKKYLLLFILLITFLSPVKALDYKNQDTNYKAVIEDKADLLSEEEEHKLLDQIIPLTEFGHIVFHSTDSNNTSVDTYANNYYYSNYNNESGTIFLIDMSNRKIYIVSSGANYKTITRAKAEIITDNIYKYATNKKYYECASKAFEQVSTLLNNGKIAEPMRYASNVVLSLLIAFLINFIFVFFYSKVKRASLEEVMSKVMSSMEVSNITGTKTGVESVYSPVEHSSGGGSSSGGGGGGGFSGGGGGHSF